MEPWFGNHGNMMARLTIAECRKLLQWSRGSVTTETPLSRALAAIFAMLQWSRGSVTTETRWERPTPCFRLWLQWSRGSVTTETTPSPPVSGKQKSFNGAVVR